MGYYPQESLYFRPISTMGTRTWTGYTRPCPLKQIQVGWKNSNYKGEVYNLRNTHLSIVGHL